jgi:hypothetical protein
MILCRKASMRCVACHTAGAVSATLDELELDAMCWSGISAAVDRACWFACGPDVAVTILARWVQDPRNALFSRLARHGSVGANRLGFADLDGVRPPLRDRHQAGIHYLQALETLANLLGTA